MAISLERSHMRTLALAVAVSALSFAIGFKFFSKAFPEASIQFRVNRSDSQPLAANFLASRGISAQGYQHAVIFDYDDTAKLYLERTQGLERMNRLTRGPVHIWRWDHRWFRPQHKEEFRVDISPAGQVVGFEHDIPDTRSGANLTQADARTLAENFLQAVMKKDLADLEFLEGSTTKRRARTDHNFTWKVKSVDLGAGSLRLSVEVAGDQVMGYHEFVKIPEDWLRGYENLRARNNSAQVVDEVFWILLSVAMLVILIQRLRDRDVPVLLALGFGGVAAVLSFLSSLNTYPLSLFGYSTTDSFSSFFANYIFQSAISAIGSGVFIFLLVAVAEPVYREAFPRFVAIRRYISWEGLRSRSFFMANVIGITLTFFFFAYQTIFYLIANKLGAWAPTDIPFSNDLNTAIPWVAVLFGGFFPAVTEEMQFRAFAIPFLHKITRNWPLAIVLAAFNWGFLHSAYPNQPFFIRGVEVGLGGLVTGVIMLRFGIVATLIWHYTVDALYTALLLLRSPNHYLMISGGLSAGIMLLPLIVALAAYLRSGTFSDETPLTNAVMGVVRAPRGEEKPQPAAAILYQPLDPRRMAWAAGVSVVLLAVLLVKVPRLGQGLKLATSKSSAIILANSYLAQHGVQPASYQHVAWLFDNVDSFVVRYLLENRDIRQTDRIYQMATKPLLWEVRYFKPLQKEEHVVFVDAVHGQVFGYRHILEEDAPGATLTPDQARTLAESALRAEGIPLESFDMQQVESQVRKARKDYSLTFQAKPGDPRNVAQALYRVQVQVSGDQVTGMIHYFKLPEAWTREQEASHLSNTILTVVKVLLGGLVFAAVVWLLVMQVRGGAMPWKPSLKVGLLIALIFVLRELNAVPMLMQQYNTSMSITNFRVQASVGLAVVPIVVGLSVWLLIALATSLYPEAWNVLNGAARRVWRRDAAFAVAVSLAISAGLHRLLQMLAAHFHTIAPLDYPAVSPLLSSASPGGGYFLNAFTLAITGAAGAGIGIYLALRLWRQKPWYILGAVLLLLVSLGPSGAHSGGEYVLGWLLNFVPVLVGLLFVVLLFRNNVLAYLAVGFFSSVVNAAYGLLSQPAPFFHWNGVLLVLLSAGVLFWMLMPGSKGARQEAAKY